jgi:hypothetical protein
MITSPGVYRMSMDAYHADPCKTPSLSRGMVKDLLELTPQHVWFNSPRLNPAYQPEEKEEKFDIGTAAHSLFLQGEDIVRVVEADDWRTKLAKEAREAARKEGKVPLLAHQYERVVRLVAASKKKLVECEELGIVNLEVEGDSELSYFWKEGDLWLRCRPDWVSKDAKVILDYKTTDVSANPEVWGSKIATTGLDIQEHLYRRGVFAVQQESQNLVAWPKFIFFVQEIFPPYLASFVSASPRVQDLGRQKTNMGIFVFNKCLEDQVWDSYPKRVCYVEAPEWAYNAWDKKAAEIGI